MNKMEETKGDLTLETKKSEIRMCDSRNCQKNNTLTYRFDANGSMILNPSKRVPCSADKFGTTTPSNYGTISDLEGKISYVKLPDNVKGFVTNDRLGKLSEKFVEDYIRDSAALKGTQR